MTRKSNFTLTAGLAALSLVLAGCASKVKLDEPAPVESRTPTAIGSSSSSSGMAGGAGGTAGGTGQSGVASVDLSRAGGTSMNANLERIVYFDYDSFVVKDEFRPVVEGNARVLSVDRTRRLSIEGHTDERGSREYNLALGQKRAESVARALSLLGANESQVEAVSFGKERPAVVGNDEAAYAKNRRAEMIAR